MSIRTFIPRVLLCTAAVTTAAVPLTIASAQAAQTIADTSFRLGEQAKVRADAEAHGSTASFFADQMPAVKVENWGTAQGAIGTYFNADTNSYVVALPKTAPAALPADFGGQPVTIKHSTKSKADVDDTESQVIKFAQGAGHANAFTFDYDADKDAVLVTTDAPPEVQSALHQAVPQVVIESSPTTFRQESADQFNDKTPHYGGARITTQTIGNCTSGFSMVNRNAARTPYSVTAAHCTALHYNVASGQYFFGQVSSIPQPGTYDVAKIEGCCVPQNYVGLLYRSRYDSTQVNGASDPTTGHLGLNGVCVAGGFTGERCGASVVSLNTTVCVPFYGCIHGLIKYNKNNNDAMTQPGDSGAPVYYHEGHTGLAHIIGMHLGAGTKNNIWSGYAEKYSSVSYVTNGDIRRFTG
ncbi:S1 family peptidase [Kibdelosporangium philippinense]|uniref:S1 family peptidase n=1 Tax=Kibdelosporangium philippinense TaxID=211113 RepID=A0ABS8Z4M7_9PSEU|nr:S1 family peptidase [Kibdelosporangium philippinense]MCE7002432.1 S1 family peptidase [Kibdelosporangium philippinense]